MVLKRTPHPVELFKGFAVSAILYLSGKGILEICKILHNAYEAYGLALFWNIGKTLGAIFLVWFVGHVVHGLETGYACPGCSHVCVTLFSEYWHKRKCLPYLTNYT